ncbi:hypothetical protein [Caballeronia sp. BCC1704]|uniref:hypothetical protein n=1 Tax=Caballeronia sp. BCC1704 TaxID=2676300 RepID=UPI00158C16EB|nr:hypothetical protein [Caballeronia sp. BCC1704]
MSDVWFMAFPVLAYASYDRSVASHVPDSHSAEWRRQKRRTSGIGLLRDAAGEQVVLPMPFG